MSPPVPATLRVAHVLAEFSTREAMGRTVLETASRVPGQHFLITARAHDGHPALAGVLEIGGSVGTFPVRRQAALAAALEQIRPDVVHVHAGALGLGWAALPALRPWRKVLTVYAWPTIPPVAQMRGSTLAEMRTSNVLQPRVLATSVLHPAAARRLLRFGRVGAVLSPDPRVLRLLGPSARVPVHRLASGAPADDRRARFHPEHPDRPVILFAGRAETVRGLDTLLDAFPAVLARVPGARLRLLLLPRPELPAILSRIRGADVASAVEVVTDPVPDLLGAMASAQVGAWPFKFDYTTSPPAMALVEAMSVGLPVVGTDVACVRSVLDPERGGLVVPAGRPDALAAALNRLLTDRELWERSARTAVTITRERCGWDNAARTTERSYASSVA